MSGISYHELQMNAPKNSPAQRKQFLLICVGGFSIFLHSVITAGIMEPVSIFDDGVYPGGEYVHKLIVRDYAASIGAIRLLEEDLESIIQENVNEDEKTVELNLDRSMDPVQPTVKDPLANFTFSVFFDDTDVSVPGGQGRFCAGVLLDSSRLHIKELLLEMNTKISKKDDGDFWSYEYESHTLPSVSAIVATFPFTNGFISALIHKYKVHPAMIRFAKERSIEGPIIITTHCDAQESVCTHYIPLEQSGAFLMGHPDSETYAKSIPPQKIIDIDPAIKLIKSTFGFGGTTNDEL